MIAQSLLLPWKTRWWGGVIFVLGFIFSYLRFILGIKPVFLNAKVFAIYSKYLDSKYFQIIGNHLSEEICLFFLILGSGLLALSKQKNEKSEYIYLRVNSFLFAIYFNSAFLLLSVLFVYGLAFIGVIAISMISIPLIYFLIFQFKVFQYNKKK